MTKDVLIEKTDKAIGELVCDKTELRKAYNYYNGVRDAELFRYLEEVYGMNNPTSLHFTPLLKKHIDALIGEYMDTPVIPQIFCKDSETISNIDRDKQLEIAKQLSEFLLLHLKNAIYEVLKGKEVNDTLIERQLKQIIDDIDTSFVSQYEIAAQNVLTYIMQSRETDFLTILRDLLLDLLITGYGFYKVEPSLNGNNIKIKVLNPLDTFIDRNTESQYVKNSYRAVSRHWLTKQEILAKYGKDLTKEDIKTIEDEWEHSVDSQSYYITLTGLNTRGIYAGKEVSPIPTTERELGRKVIPVYEVEWIETDSDFIMQRYETIRIGNNIYVLKGKNRDIVRSKDNPAYCGLSINGIYFLNRGQKPYSMILACAHLQDQYDLLIFYRDNLIANSGTIGDWIDYTLIPASLGTSLPERVMKWQALKKQGIGLLDSSQEGRQQINATPLNTIFNGYDNTVKAQSIQAILYTIDSIEQTASSITGVFRERLNNINAKDAVTNVQIGQRNSFTITKLYYHLMDLLVNEILVDCLNTGKIVFSKGLTGTIILGDKYQKAFTAYPKYFTVTDYDVRIITSADIVRDMESIKMIIPQFIQSGNLPPDIIIEAMTSKSIPDLKNKVRKSLQIQKEERSRQQLLEQQLQQLQKELEATAQELAKAKNALDSASHQKLQLDAETQKAKMQVEWYRAKSEKEYKDALMEEKKKRTSIELMLLHDSNPYNDQVHDL